ncbi:hypothetical protein ACVIQT_000156 [Bradyrhizobium diazoefficiens]
MLSVTDGCQWPNGDFIRMEQRGLAPLSRFAHLLKIQGGSDGLAVATSLVERVYRPLCLLAALIVLL